MFVVCPHDPCDRRMLYFPETGLLDVRPRLCLVASLHVPDGWQGMPAAERATSRARSALDNPRASSPLLLGAFFPVPDSQRSGVGVPGWAHPALSIVLCDARTKGRVKGQCVQVESCLPEPCSFPDPAGPWSLHLCPAAPSANQAQEPRARGGLSGSEHQEAQVGANHLLWAP